MLNIQSTWLPRVKPTAHCLPHHVNHVPCHGVQPILGQIIQELTQRTMHLPFNHTHMLGVLHRAHNTPTHRTCFIRLRGCCSSQDCSVLCFQRSMWFLTNHATAHPRGANSACGLRTPRADCGLRVRTAESAPRTPRTPHFEPSIGRWPFPTAAGHYNVPYGTT